ncbi:MAG: flagellar biosynthetic protein FliO [Hyphomicrobiales bacterium]|nr:flagellar biosynthetic protein FliO [Hyphomicrobiales bacterium]
MSGFRDWLDTLFGSDGGRAVQMLFALLIVVLLILAVTWLFRRLFGTTLARGRSHRLAVVDSTAVDGHRRLLLVRRDEVEHLVMIGGPNDLLVESRILKAPPVLAGRPGAPATAARPQAARPVPPPPTAVEPPAPTAAPAPTPTPALVEEPAPSALAGATASAKARAAAGAAGMVAAMASAGALLRSRVVRPEPKPSEPVDLDAPDAGRQLRDAAEPPRRTLDEAFDAPLGRPAPDAPIRPAAPTRPAVQEPTPPPVVAEASKSIERAFFEEPVRREPAIEPVAPTEPSKPTPSPVIRPTTRNLDEIDLLADFEAISAEFSAKPAAAPIAPPPVEPPTRHEPPVFSTAAPAVEPPPIVVAEEAPAVEPPIETAVEPKFDFDFGFTPPAAREPEPAPLAAETAEPVVAAPPVEIAAPSAEPLPEATLDLRPEPVVTATPPAPSAPVDELEEEMARLLAELSGQTRR